MTCECVKEINNLLEPKGEELDLAAEVGSGRTGLMVRVRKIIGGRGKVTNLMVVHCPFCGAKQ